MISQFIKVTASLFFLLHTLAHADVWVFDINDTITLRNDVDPEKTTAVVINQLVAQNTYLKDEPTTSLEAYIKRTISNKTQQRETYKNLTEYVHTLIAQNLASEEIFVSMPILVEQYRTALAEANSTLNRGFFPSFYHMIDFILTVDDKPTIIFQSFGEEIPLALEAIACRYSEKLATESEIGFFDDQDQLNFKGNIYKNPGDMMRLLAPGIVMGWKNNYRAGGRKLMFFKEHVDKTAFLNTHFFDDNAHRFASVYIESTTSRHIKLGAMLPIEVGYSTFSDYIYQVDTAKALTDTAYFINLTSKHQLMELAHQREVELLWQYWLALDKSTLL